MKSIGVTLQRTYLTKKQDNPKQDKTFTCYKTRPIIDHLKEFFFLAISSKFFKRV